MRRGADNIGKLERELEALRTTIAETQAEGMRHADLAADADREKRRTAGDAAAFNQATETARLHRTEAERLGYVLDDHAKTLAELERRLAHARFYEEYEAVSSAADRRNAAATKLNSELASAAEAETARDAAHDELAAAVARARAICPDDVEFQFPPAEPAFPAETRRLIEALEPRLRAQAEARVRDEAHRQGDPDGTVAAQAAREALKDRDYERISRLTPGQLLKLIPAAEKLARTLPGNDRDREIVEKRLERIRELVAGAETVGA